MVTESKQTLGQGKGNRNRRTMNAGAERDIVILFRNSGVHGLKGAHNLTSGFRDYKYSCLKRLRYQ